MNIKRLIYEEMLNVLKEAYEDKNDVQAKKNDIEKQKNDLEKKKQTLDQQKLDFQKKKETNDDREQDKEDQEQDQEQSQDGGEQEAKPNISFKTQGDFYQSTSANLNNLTLANGDLLDDAEKNYISLATQAAQGRLDKGFVKFLRKGKAGNVYGKDFSDMDIKKIISYMKEHELIR